MISDKKVFITGGAGFIGWATVEEMIKNNEVTIYDNFSRSKSIEKISNASSKLKLIKGDILDTRKLKKSVKGHEIIVHCAAIAGRNSVANNPVSTLSTNMIGSANVLSASLANTTTERVICLSTSEIYGPHAKNASEEQPSLIYPPNEPRWSYAASKTAEEHLAFAYLHEHQLPITILRPFNIYGPGQKGEGAVKDLISLALSNKPLEITGNGEQTRSWCYIKDMVEAILLSSENTKAIGKIFNVGGEDDPISIRDLAKLIITISGSDSELIEIPKRNAEIQDRSPDTSAAKKILGFKTTVGLVEGIEKTIDWTKKQ